LSPGRRPGAAAGDGGLGAALFDALDLIGGPPGQPGQFADIETGGAAPVIHRQPRSQGLAAGDPLRIINCCSGRVQWLWNRPSHLPFIGFRCGPRVVTLACLLSPDRTVDLPVCHRWHYSTIAAERDD